MLQFILADIAQCETIDDDDREKLYRLSQEKARLAGEASKEQEVNFSYVVSIDH